MKNIASLLHSRDFNRAYLWVKSFMNEHRLFPTSGSAFVGVSGGLDSVFLLHILARLKKDGILKSLTCLHIDHGTREDNQKDWEFVERLCSDFNIDFCGKKLNLSLEQANFELIARNERYRFFESKSSNGDAVYLAHHIDDSFEWSLMSQFKSSSISSGSLGIPLKNNRYIRPLLCLSRGQIEKFADSINISYRNDSSNSDLSFERNYIRKVLVPKIKSRYPKYLKHYVFRSNKIAKKDGKHLIYTLNKKDAVDNLQLYSVRDFGVLLYSTSLKEINLSDAITNSVFKVLSESNRGSTSKQVDKLEKAFKTGKEGPLDFSGGVKAFIDRPFIFFTNSSGLRKLEALDDLIFIELSNIICLDEGFSSTNFLKANDQQFSIESVLLQDCLQRPWNWSPFFFICSKNDFVNNISFQRRSFLKILPKTTALLVKKKWWFCTPGQLARNRSKLRDIKGRFVKFHLDLLI